MAANNKNIEPMGEMLASIVDLSEDAIITKSLDGNILSWNNGAERIYGYTDEEVIGKNVDMLAPSDLKNEIKDILLKIRNGERINHFETKRVTKDGRIIDISITISPIKDSAGAIIGASTIARDITERKDKEKTLLGLLTALDKTALVSMTDDKGNILYANPKFIEISKYSLAELLGQNHRILKSHQQPDELFIELWKTISSGQVWRGEIQNKAKDNTYYWVDTSIAPIIGASNKPERYISVRFLITDKKKIEDESKQHLAELEKVNKFMIGRESRMSELKEQIVELNKKIVQSMAGDKNGKS